LRKGWWERRFRSNEHARREGRSERDRERERDKRERERGSKSGGGERGERKATNQEARGQMSDESSERGLKLGSFFSFSLFVTDNHLRAMLTRPN